MNYSVPVTSYGFVFKVPQLPWKEQTVLPELRQPGEDLTHGATENLLAALRQINRVYNTKSTFSHSPFASQGKWVFNPFPK